MATTYHEPIDELSAEARNAHRALTSLIEELEAVDWYNQRADVTDDQQLKAILLHNRNEEIEHAAMCLEYLRRMIPEFDGELQTYLFTTAPIDQVEELEAGGEAEGEGGEATPAAPGDLKIGQNRKGA